MMRLVVALIVFTASNLSVACDEACQREQAEAKHATKFPSFLSWKYCDRLKYDFMTSEVSSLLKFGKEHFQTKYKGPTRNIVRMIDERETWLKECDDYELKTRNQNVFYDKKTTDKIFGQLASVKKELNAVLKGQVYSSPSEDDTGEIVAEKFQALYDTVDTHKNLMHLKGKLVY